MLLKDYYKTKWWKEFRSNLTKDKSCKCEICGKKRWEKYKSKDCWKKPVVMHIHHKRYHLFKEQRNDILILCSSCHKLGHDLEMMARTRDSVYTTMYDIFKQQTKWEYNKYK